MTTADRAVCFTRSVPVTGRDATVALTIVSATPLARPRADDAAGVFFARPWLVGGALTIAVGPILARFPVVADDGALDFASAGASERGPAGAFGGVLGDVAAGPEPVEVRLVIAGTVVVDGTVGGLVGGVTTVVEGVTTVVEGVVTVADGVVTVGDGVVTVVTGVVTVVDGIVAVVVVTSGSVGVVTVVIGVVIVAPVGSVGSVSVPGAAVAAPPRTFAAANPLAARTKPAADIPHRARRFTAARNPPCALSPLPGLIPW